MKHLLAIIALMTLSGGARAVILSQDGTGQVLIFPFYSVNQTGGGRSMDTLVVVNNESAQAKAVRLTVREAFVGHAVLQVNVYLGPLDSWSFALTDDEGVATLRTEDQSCSVPDIVGSGVALSTAIIQAAADGLQTEASERLRQGYIEVIELGVLGGEAAALVTPEVEQGVVLPPDCEALRSRWLPAGSWAQDPAFEVGAPAGGLSGHVWLVDVLGGHAYDYSAIAIQRFSQQVLHRGDASELGLDAVNAPAPTAPGKTLSTILTAQGPVDLVWERPLDALTSVLMTDALISEVSIESSLDASVEMIISLPTKRHYVFAGYADGQPVPGRPFANPLGNSGAYSGSLPTVIDRTGSYQDLSTICLDPPPPPAGLNWAVQSFSDAGFEEAASITGAAGSTPIFEVSNIDRGKLRVDFSDNLPGSWWCGDSPRLQNPGMEGITGADQKVHLPGLPAVGLSLQQVSYDTLESAGETVLSNYGVSFAARREPKIEASE